MALVEVLLALIAVLVTIALTVLGALWRELVWNLKPDVQAIMHRLFGDDRDGTDEGLVDDVAKLDDRLQEAKQDRKQEHEEVETRLDRLNDRVDRVISALQQNDDIEIRVNTENKSDHDWKE